jgi:ribonuclease VapC
MVIDTSALTAILAKEPERDAFLKALAASPVRRLSAVTALETSIVIEARYGPEAVADLELLLYVSKIEIAAFDAKQFEAAARAWRNYGKGNHPARLNFGDCCVYALAKTSGEPVLCKGNDFPQTDLEIVRSDG